MPYNILSAQADSGGSVTQQSRSVTTEYMAGYEQTVRMGRMATKGDLSVTFSDDYDDVILIYNFLKAQMASMQPFWYSKYPPEPARLYILTADITFNHVQGRKWSVSTTFKEYTGL